MDYIIMENGEKILLETQQKVTIQRTVDIYKQYRKELGLTQSELGKRAGISQPNITRFESGNYNPSLEFLVKIAGAMGKKSESYSGRLIRGQ
ncbi:MAG: helix-turn-helix domain-containing protein [Oliverpabstia sp.]